VSPLWTSMFKAFGAAPASININEAYSAMQTKLVEGQENPLALIDLYKFYEVQKFVSVTNHMWDGFWTLANGRVWAALPKDLQGIVERNLNEAAKQERADVAALNASLQGALSQKGMAFNNTDAEKFRAALRTAGFYAEWKEKYGAEAWAVLESQVGALS
jgi:TRAP-type C4-dicarboxylate transport system substrate-binding protein